MARRARRRSAKMASKKIETNHEHFVKKSFVVSVISAIIIALGVLNLSVYASGSVNALAAELSTTSFWIAAVVLIVIALLVDYAKSSLKKVFWVEDIFGGIFGAVVYYAVISFFGTSIFTTAPGFVIGYVELFVFFYVGFAVGRALDNSVLKPAGININ